jgi:hypothetical protein
MGSDFFPSDRPSLEIQLQSRSERFDYVLEHNEDLEEAKIIYREIKELKSRLNEMNPKEVKN